MRKLLYIFLLFFSVSMMANDTIQIPLTMSVFQLLPQDGPTGSTPDPADPNQFRASLTGNTLLLCTQNNAVSYVVIQETESERYGEDYFYSLSYGTVSCPITRPGFYTIRIGYWNTDFIGYLFVKDITLYDFNGHFYGHNLENRDQLSPGFYFLRVQTSIGTTTTKFFKR